MARRFRQWLSRAVCLVCGLGLASDDAWAHAGFRGVGDLWNGSLHLVFDPVQALTLVALGLALGRMLAARGRAPVTWYQVSFAGGLLVALGLLPAGTDTLAPLPLAAAGLLLIDPGGLLGAHPAIAIASVSALAGLAFGAAIPTEVTRFTFALGTCLGAIVLPLYPLALVERYHRPWFSIAARILGSWLIAVAVILLGNFLHQGR